MLTLSGWGPEYVRDPTPNTRTSPGRAPGRTAPYLTFHKDAAATVGWEGSCVVLVRWVAVADATNPLEAAVWQTVWARDWQTTPCGTLLPGTCIASAAGPPTRTWSVSRACHQTQKQPNSICCNSHSSSCIPRWILCLPINSLKDQQDHSRNPMRCCYVSSRYAVPQGYTALHIAATLPEQPSTPLYAEALGHMHVFTSDCCLVNVRAWCARQPGLVPVAVPVTWSSCRNLNRLGETSCASMLYVFCVLFLLSLIPLRPSALCSKLAD